MRLAIVRVGLIAGLVAGLFAQTEGPRPVFDVVSVKATPPERLNHLKSERCNGGGPYVTEGTPVLWAIEFAYHLNDTDLAAGWPAWLESFADAYDIQGKSEHPVTDRQCAGRWSNPCWRIDST